MRCMPSLKFLQCKDIIESDDGKDMKILGREDVCRVLIKHRGS